MGSLSHRVSGSGSTARVGQLGRAHDTSCGWPLPGRLGGGPLKRCGLLVILGALLASQSGCVFMMDWFHPPRDPWKAGTRADLPGPLAGKSQPIGQTAAPVVASAPQPRYSTQLAPASYAPYYGRRIGALVGIDQYQNWSRLEGAGADISRMRQMLLRSGFDQIVELRDGEATRSNILKLLGDRLPKIVDQEDLVLIYFSGHGETETLADGAKRGYLIPVDGERESPFASAISMDQLRELAHRLPAKHVLYVMDSCYSGLGFIRGASIPPTTSEYLAKITRLRAVQMITAGGEGEVAIEKGGRGLFTSYVTRALEGEADYNSDGYVTVSELGAYLRPQVSAASNNGQTPQFGSLEGTGEIALSVAR